MNIIERSIQNERDYWEQRLCVIERNILQLYIMCIGNAALLVLIVASLILRLP